MGAVRVRVELMASMEGRTETDRGAQRGGDRRRNASTPACGYRSHPSSMDRGAVKSARPVRAPCTLLHAHGDGVVRLGRRVQPPMCPPQQGLHCAEPALRRGRATATACSTSTRLRRRLSSLRFDRRTACACTVASEAGGPSPRMAVPSCRATPQAGPSVATVWFRAVAGAQAELHPASIARREVLQDPTAHALPQAHTSPVATLHHPKTHRDPHHRRRTQRTSDTSSARSHSR
jgi:hypothetical protein